MSGAKYSFKGSVEVEVTEHDRSGYAHFNNESGVGAYNNDGTLKSNAVVVYITEEKRLYSETVTGKEKLFFIIVPDCKSIYAVYNRQYIFA